VHNKFSVKYFLNLVLVDEEDRRYFKQHEITLFRRAEGSGTGGPPASVAPALPVSTPPAALAPAAEGGGGAAALPAGEWPGSPTAAAAAAEPGGASGSGG